MVGIPRRRPGNRGTELKDSGEAAQLERAGAELLTRPTVLGAASGSWCRNGISSRLVRRKLWVT